MPWNNLPADAATDWSSIDFLNQFVEAYNERYLSLRQVMSSSRLSSLWAEGHGVFPSFSEGDVIAKTITGDNSLDTTIYSLQLWIHRIWAASVDPDRLWYTPGQMPSPVPGDGYQNLHSSRGFWRVPQFGTPDRDWTRKYPREIDSLSAEGEAGWRARYLSTLSSDKTDLYDHDGTNWVLSENQASPPDVIEEVGPYAFMVVGDYIGAWIFNEMQQRLIEAINFIGSLQLQSLTPWTIVENPSAGTAGQRTTGLTDTEAKATAQADWPVPDNGFPGSFSGEFSTSTTPAIYSYWGVPSNFDLDNYTAGLYSNVITYTPPPLNHAGPDAPSRLFDIFALAEASDFPPSTSYMFYPGNYFDHGWGLAEDFITPVGLGIDDASVTVGNTTQPSFAAGTLPKYFSPTNAKGDGFKTQMAVIIRPEYEYT